MNEKNGNTITWMIRIVCAAVALLVAGCISVDLESKGAKWNEPICERCFCACIWGGFWWCENPGEVCKMERHANEHGEYLDMGYRDIHVGMNPLCLFTAFATAGIIVPMHVECNEAKRPVAASDFENPIEM